MYGPVPGANRATAVLRKSNLGVCGVCRRPMKVGDGDGGKSNSMSLSLFGRIFPYTFGSSVVQNLPPSQAWVTETHPHIILGEMH